MKIQMLQNLGHAKFSYSAIESLKYYVLIFHSCTVHLDIIKVLLFHQWMDYIFV